jgi:pSer/pThr/pTyr-binding forkhead associated (FHA) protein
MNMATLYKLAENGSRAERWDIDDDPVVVGRSGQAKVNIEDDGLSRRHFLISRDGEGYLIKDLNSRNGTWVDGRRVFAEKLRHNDCIRAGNSVFLFAEPPVAAAMLSQGPHGTVIIPAAPRSDRHPAESIAWQAIAGAHQLEAAA